LLACGGPEELPSAGRRHTIARHRQGQVPSEVELWRAGELEPWSIMPWCCPRPPDLTKNRPHRCREPGIGRRPSMACCKPKNEQGMRGSAASVEEGRGKASREVDVPPAACLFV